MRIKQDAKIQATTGDEASRKLEREAVQGLASKVRDEEHWQHILASAEGTQREELERVVGPMLPFRRAAPCTTPECESGHMGMWRPVLVVSSPLAPEDLFYVPIDLNLCSICKVEAQVEDFLVDTIWSQILAAWQGEQYPPVRRRTTLMFDRIH